LTLFGSMPFAGGIQPGVAATHSERFLAESVYLRIRSDLLQGRIAAGQRVTELWAAERYQASRTPVREACRRLAEEGLLVHRPRFGYRVARIEHQEICDLYEMRRALEAVALRRACSAEGPRAGLAEVRRAWTGRAPKPGEDVLYRDEAFHVGIAEVGGNGAVVASLEAVNARIRMVRVHDFLDADRIAATIDQHLAILDAIERRDAPAACELMESHILESQQLTTAMVLSHVHEAASA
jgi:DNA-binding GntR family transcriptional regulator